MKQERMASQSRSFDPSALEQEAPEAGRSTAEEVASEPPQGGSNALDDGWPQ